MELRESFVFVFRLTVFVCTCISGACLCPASADGSPWHVEAAGLVVLPGSTRAFGKLLDLELELEPSGSHPWLAFVLSSGENTTFVNMTFFLNKGLKERTG